MPVEIPRKQFSALCQEGFPTPKAIPGSQMQTTTLRFVLWNSLLQVSELADERIYV